MLLPGESHGWRSLVGCSQWGCEESDTTERLHFHFSLFMHWRRKWQPTPVFLPGESQGWRSLVGCRLWGRTESDTTEATSQQQQIKLLVTCIIIVLCLVTQPCLTLCDPMDCSPPGPSVHGILQAKILEWVAMPSSR